MKIEDIDIDATIDQIKEEILKDPTISLTIKSLINLLILVVKLLTNRVTLSSKNSSKPPSSDPNRGKKPRGKSNKKSGGQPGHEGKNLEQVDDPDHIEKIEIDRRTIPKGNYSEAGVEKRQVFDIEIITTVTEYQAQILLNIETGKKFTAPFPKEIKSGTQYGDGVKAHSVYLSQYQLLPYSRIQELFTEFYGLPISEGSIYNFIKEAYLKAESFETKVKDILLEEDLLHVDETSVNINGEREWLHCVSNQNWTHLYPHEKRGFEAIKSDDVLEKYCGVLCHDHWKPYYKLTKSKHALCNAHHLRELTCASEQDNMQWAEALKQFLEEINIRVKDKNGSLKKDEILDIRIKYRKILSEGEQECPPPDEANRDGKRGRLKRTKSRNLLERLTKYEDDVLRFVETVAVPFTNNQAERDLRMTKVQQKISGCFRSFEGAEMFCRLRGYLSTCRKQKMKASDALNLLFKGELPQFIQE